MDLGNFVHNLTHHHSRMRKEGVGSLTICWPRGFMHRMSIYVRPEFKGTRWHKISLPKSSQEDHVETVIHLILVSETPHELVDALILFESAWEFPPSVTS